MWYVLYKEYITNFKLLHLTSLEILDISRNKIHSLPRKLSQLKSLKVRFSL
jgi:Leucine-rich repeat (LRR) protein